MTELLFPTALDVVRAATGLFFLLSGYHKLFNKERHASLVQTLIDCKIPYIGFMQWWVPGWEFLGGALMILGWWPGVIVGGGALLVISIIACWTDGRKRIASYRPIDFADVVDDVLYLPEFIYAMLILMFMAQAATQSGLLA